MKRTAEVQITVVLDDGHDREPINVIIWIRKSQTDSSTSLARQIWSALTQRAPPLKDLRAHDRIIIVVEVCSSSKHPFTDREVHKLVPTDLPMHIITSNPDRMTRRSDEVVDILSELGTEGKWYTQAAKFEHVKQRTWIDVSQYVDDIQEQLRIDRQRALQAGYYAQCHSIMKRVLALNDTNTSQPQVKSFQTFLGLTMKVHFIKRLLVVVRVSSDGDGDEDDTQSSTASLDRQVSFLTMLLPNNAVIKIIRLQNVSAFSGRQVIDSIRDSLGTGEGKAMIVSTSLDRIVRSQENVNRLQELLAPGHHIAVSMLWDSTTIIQPKEAMLLAPAM